MDVIQWRSEIERRESSKALVIGDVPVQTVKPLTTAAVSRKVAGNYIAFGEEVAGELDLTSRLAFRVQRGSRSW